MSSTGTTEQTDCWHKAALRQRLLGKKGLAVKDWRNPKAPIQAWLRVELVNGKKHLVLETAAASWRQRFSRRNRVSSKRNTVERIPWESVAAVCKSVQVKGALWLIGANHSTGKRRLGLVNWRLELDGSTTPAGIEAFQELLQSEGCFHNGILTNILPTNGVALTSETKGFVENMTAREEADLTQSTDDSQEEGEGEAADSDSSEDSGAQYSVEVDGLAFSCNPDYSDMGVTSSLRGALKRLGEMGGKAPMVASVFQFLTVVIATYEKVQGVKTDLLELLRRWFKVADNLKGEEGLGGDIVGLAEDFFFQLSVQRGFSADDFAASLERLRERMDSAVASQTLDVTLQTLDVSLQTLNVASSSSNQLAGVNENVKAMHADVKALAGTTASRRDEESDEWARVQSILPQKRKLLGRRDELRLIGDELEQGRAIVALSGVGGCGKSHLGIEAALQWTRKKESLRVAFFLSAENETSCRSSLLQIMKKLGLDPVLHENGEPISTEELFQRVYKKLDEAPSDFRVLWVLDNVPVVDGLDLLTGWFGPAESRDWNRFCYLLTSQSTAYRGKTRFGDIERVRVDPLPTDVSIDLLMKGFSKLSAQEDEMVAAKELVDKFCHNLPVAILAVAGMINRPMTFRSYVKKLQEKNVTAGVDSVAAVLQDALSHARQHDGLSRMLDVAAFVSPDDIPLSLLEDESLVGRLCELNLLQVVSDERYSMHRLIQEAARVDRSATHAIGALKNAMDSYGNTNPATWASGVSMLTHVESLRTVADVACVLSSTLPQEAMLSYANLMNRCGDVYGTVLCKLLSCRQLHEDALRIFRAVYGETALHADIARTLHNVGYAYWNLGNFKRAIEFYEQALTMERAVYGETAVHSDIAITLNNLGAAYLDLGDVKRAIELFKQALTMRRAVYGETAVHSEIAISLNNVGSAYRDLGDDERAIEFYEQALTMYRAVYGETAVHSLIAITLHNLGEAYESLGDVRKAIELFKQALTMYRAVYGETAVHSAIAATLNNLGTAYWSLGDVKRAIEFHEQALTMFRAVYGETAAHLEIAISLNNLGTAYWKLGDVKRGIEFYKQALTMYRAVYGETAVHSEIAISLDNLGTANENLGDVERAIEFYEQALTMKRAVYGETAVHLEIAISLNNLGVAYNNLGNVERAIEFCKRALTMRRAVHNENDQHPDIQSTLRLLKSLEQKKSGCSCVIL